MVPASLPLIAFFIVVVWRIVFAGLQRRSRARRIVARRRQHNNLRAGPQMQLLTKWTLAQRAAKYLRRIARLTGAKRVHGESYRLKAGRRHFLVDSKFVRLICPHGESTCFSVATEPDMPSAEVVATALLQLKNNPGLFEKWIQLQGDTFKANGKIFKDPYQLRRDET